MSCSERQIEHVRRSHGPHRSVHRRRSKLGPSRLHRRCRVRLLPSVRESRRGHESAVYLEMRNVRTKEAADGGVALEIDDVVVDMLSVVRLPRTDYLTLMVRSMK